MSLTESSAERVDRGLAPSVTVPVPQGGTAEALTPAALHPFHNTPYEQDNYAAQRMAWR
jgi:hypothetical protein